MNIPHELFILVPLAFVTGIINAAVGGGGLIQVPGLFATLPLASPAQIMGTDKFSAIMGHAASSRQYARQLNLPWKLVLWTTLAAFAGSYAGVRAMYLVPAQWMRPVVIVVLAAMLVYTWFRPQFGIHDEQRAITPGDLKKGLALGAVIGFYDGFIGPGTGSFLLFLFVRIFHFDFLRATACAKVVNMGTNLAALVFLIPAGMVFYHYAIPMSVASILGALIGTKAAIRAGNQWIRTLFLVLAVSLLCKLTWETVRVWL